MKKGASASVVHNRETKVSFWMNAHAPFFFCETIGGVIYTAVALRTCDIHAGERLFAFGHGAMGWPGRGGGGTYWTELQVRFRWQACKTCETGQSFQSLRFDLAGRRVKLIKLNKTCTQNLLAGVQNL